MHERILLTLGQGDYVFSTTGDFEKNLRDGRLAAGEIVYFYSDADAEEKREEIERPDADISHWTEVETQ